MGNKFNVGDKVVGNKMANGRYSITKEGWKGVVTEIDESYIKVREDSNEFTVNPNCFDLIKPSCPKIIITTDGTTTTGKMYENGKITKTAKAECNHKEDTFDFKRGAKYAFDRLMSPYNVGDKVEVIGDTCSHSYPIGKILTLEKEYRSSSFPGEICWIVKEGNYFIRECDIKPYVAPKYYNGKVVCISSDNEDFTAGKVYEVKDGKLTDNYGEIRPNDFDDTHITCVEDLASKTNYFSDWYYKFIPFVEN